MLLLVYGALLGVWTLLDPNFTLQAGMNVGDFAWTDNNLPDRPTFVLACNVTGYVPNDLWFYGWHLGNALRTVSEMDPHLMLHLLLPPLLFESAYAIDFHMFSKVRRWLSAPGISA
jgi:hypothetical protein